MTTGEHAHLYFWVIGSHTISHQAKWHRQLLVHIDNGILDLCQEPVRSIKPGRA